MAINYTIEPGDTLSSIAQRYGTTVEQLALDNAIGNPDLIFAGDDLTINATGGGTILDDMMGVGSTHSAKGENQTNPFTESLTNKEADNAKNAAETRANKEKTYTARATVIGDPSLKANTLIKINNVGSKFGGHWWIKTVTHKIGSSGYLCDLDLQKDAIATEDADTSGHQGGPISTNAGTGDGPGITGPQEVDGGVDGDRVYVDPVTGRTWTNSPRPRTPNPLGMGQQEA